jgi:nucleotide-binding universal stress UspA family protein
MDASVTGRRVVVGLDGSRNSIAALHRAVTEARDMVATLEIVLVYPGPPELGGRAAGLDWLKQILSREYPGPLGLPVFCRVEHGSTGKVLVRLAHGAQLLVLGARARSEAGNPLGGDVVPVCLSYAQCPIAICADQGQRITV